MFKRISKSVAFCLMLCLIFTTPAHAAIEIPKSEYDVPYNLYQMGMGGVEEICPYKLPKITVAIIDNGLNMRTFEEFFDKSRISNKSVNMITGEVGKKYIHDSENEHGTRVASVIAKGTPDNVKLLIIKASDNGEYENKMLCDSIMYAIDAGADIINICANGINECTYEELQNDKETTYCFKRANMYGIPIICSAGNNGYHFTSDENYCSFPAEVDYTCVLSVGSISYETDADSYYNISDFSNTGGFIDYVAIGEKINVIYSEQHIKDNALVTSWGTLLGYGTSFSTPAVAAAYAIVLTYYLHDGWTRKTPRTMLRVIRSLTNSCKTDMLKDYNTDTYGNGVIDISYYIKALRRIEHKHPNRKKGCICSC